MDILWQRQADMRTILKTLPADSWVVTNSVFVRERLMCSLPHSEPHSPPVLVEEPLRRRVATIQKIHYTCNHALGTSESE